MPWTPPPLPARRREAIIAYWQAILAIPSNEPSAGILRDMASQRLVELRVQTHEDMDRFLTGE